MNYGKMEYIQRYQQGEDYNKFEGSVVRVVSGDYTGSAEFEFGSVQDSWKFLRTSDIYLEKVAVPVTDFKCETGKEPIFYVISTQKGIDWFVSCIPHHLNGTAYTRDRTNIKTLFNNAGEVSDYDKRTIAWMDVSAFVFTIDLIEQVAPVFFTRDKTLALQMFLELKRDKEADGYIPEMFEEVYSHLSHTNPVKVCGINQDESFTIKHFSKKAKVSKYDIWNKAEFEEKVFPKISIA